MNCLSTKTRFTFIFICTVIFCYTAQIASSQIKRIEPLNWWVGMKNPRLQLLVYGDSVGETKPFINYGGVSVVKSRSGDSKNYLFIDIDISSGTKAGKFNIYFKKNNRTIYTHTYQLLARQENPEARQGFTSKDVIYLITPDRFANGDTSNDAIPSMQEKKVDRLFEGGRHGGDIQGIIRHLDYIKDMGFTAIWTQPMLENDMPEYSYHGYAITDYYKVDPRYGSLDDYKELSKKMKSMGLKLIFDDVLNHIGLSHWWMKDLPFRNWLNYQDSPVITTHQRTTNQDIHASQYDKDLMTKGWFVPSMPDMNGKNPFVATYLTQRTIWWIETLQLGGVRQDTYGYSDKDLLSTWTCGIMNEYPQFNIVGEEWSLNPLVTSYWQLNQKHKDNYHTCLPTVMDFPLQNALVSALKDKNEDPHSDKGLNKLYESLANDFIYENPQRILIFGDNHDMDRLFTQLGDDTSLMKMALGYLLTMRGIPQIYYGTEILAQNDTHPGNHGFIRSDFPGGWRNDAVDAFHPKGLSTAQSSFQHYIKRLLNWRKNNTTIAEGNTLHFAPFDGVYVYFRTTKEKTIMVALNKNKEETKITTQRFAEILKPHHKATNVFTNDSYQESIVLPPLSTSIFEIH